MEADHLTPRILRDEPRDYFTCPNEVKIANEETPVRDFNYYDLFIFLGSKGNSHENGAISLSVQSSFEESITASTSTPLMDQS
jgi:hypothetical protein